MKSLPKLIYLIIGEFTIVAGIGAALRGTINYFVGFALQGITINVKNLKL